MMTDHYNDIFSKTILMLKKNYKKRPDKFFYCLNELKPVTRNFLHNDEFFQFLEEVMDDMVNSEIEVEEVENTIEEIGFKYFILDISLNEDKPSSLRSYAYFVQLIRSLDFDPTLTFVYKTKDEFLLECAIELEKDYKVKPILDEEINL